MNPADINLQRFNGLITQLEGGNLNNELTEKVQLCIRELSDACFDRSGTHKASLTLRLDFEMNHKDRVILIEAAINEKLPKAPRGRAGLFYCDNNGNLLRQDPRQLTMDDELQRRRTADAS